MTPRSRHIREKNQSRDRARPRPERLRAVFACLVFISGAVLGPLAHAEEHLRESRLFEAQLLQAARDRAAAPPLQPSETELALLSADALSWQEALFGDANSPAANASDSSPSTAAAQVAADLDFVYGPLVAYEVRAQEASSNREIHDDGAGKFHSHAPGQSHSHSHGGRDSTSPYDHGLGSLAHSALALHAAPPPQLIFAQAFIRTTHVLSTASRHASPAWHRPRCAQSPPEI